jgi:HlyD family secretion protein
MCHQFRLGRRGVREAVAQNLGDAPMQHLPSALEKIFVGRILNKRVLEAIVAVRRDALDEQNIGFRELLEVATGNQDSAKLAYDEAVNGATKEVRAIAQTNVLQAQASVDTIKADVDELVVKAPIAAQVYQIGAELGEYVSPGVPLLSLYDLNDVYLRFNLREDLVKGLKVGDRFKMRVPALSDQEIEAEVKLIETRGEYAGWRATRATGDFDLRTFEVRAYPVSPLPALRPGMSVYAEWPTGERK